MIGARDTTRLPAKVAGIGALALAAVLAGCTDAHEAGTVGISFSPGALTGPMADPGTPVVDDSGFAHLDLFPLFIVARVEASDLEEPVVGSWPEEVPEETPDEVVLDLAVGPGQARRITVELLVADEDGRVGTFRSPAPGRVPTMVEVVSGAVSDVEVELIELPVGTVSATWESGVELSTIAWVDDAARVILPPAEPVDGAAASVLAVGRRYWPRVVTSDGEIVDIADHVIELTSEDEILEVSLDVSE